MSSKANIALVVWIISCMGVLSITLWSYAPGPNSDIGVLFIWAMLALTFPVGLCVALLVSAFVEVSNWIGSSFLDQIPNTTGFVILWLGFVAVGYLQWFRALPWLWRRVKKKGRS